MEGAWGLGRQRMFHRRCYVWAGPGEDDGENESELAAEATAQAKSRGLGRLGRAQAANRRGPPPGTALGPPSRTGAEQRPHDGGRYPSTEGLHWGAQRREPKSLAQLGRRLREEG